MSTVGVFYQTKRGEEVPSKYRSVYLHTNLLEVGKLCLAGIFQEPCKSRNNPSASYKEDKYYTPIFNGNPERQAQVAQICKELLYIDKYFDKKFRPKVNRDNTLNTDRRQLASNARTICIAFATLAARYHQGNITDEALKIIFAAAQSDSSEIVNDLRRAVGNFGSMQSLFPKHLTANMDLYDAALDKLFEAIINAGAVTYSIGRRYDSSLVPSNYLKKDKNYYGILRGHWDTTLRFEIQKIFADV